MSYDFAPTTVEPRKQENPFAEAVQHLINDGKKDTRDGLTFTLAESEQSKVNSQLTSAGLNAKPEPVTVRRTFSDPDKKGNVSCTIRVVTKIIKGTRTVDPSAPSADAAANVGTAANTPGK